MDGSGRRNSSGETWAAARAAYLDGQSAGEVWARFGLGLSALRARARRDGWRRMDQADPDPDIEEDIDGELDELYMDYELMSERTGLLATRALLLDDAPTAERWLRLHLRILPLAERQHRQGLIWQAEEEAEEARRPPVAARQSAAAPAASEAPEPAPESPDVHSVHSVHPDSECTGAAQSAPTPVLNRAERRRRARLAAQQSRPGPLVAPARSAAAEGP